MNIRSQGHNRCRRAGSSMVVYFFAVMALAVHLPHGAEAQQAPAPTACSADIQNLVATALQHALEDARDLPDLPLVSEYGSIYVLDHLWGNECTLGADVLPESAAASYVLVSRDDLIELSASLGTDIAYVRGGEAMLTGSTASMWLGAALQPAAGDLRGVMCCCGGAIEFDRVDGSWEYRQWGLTVCA